MLTAVIPTDEHVDVRAGKCTYGQMVELGRVLDAAYKGEVGEAEAIKRLIKVLHKDTSPVLSLANARYAEDIADGVRFWREAEAKMLKHEPTAEERQAGYERLAESTGPVGVAISLAEKFGVHNGPDAVFEWPYGQVFQVLRVDLERYKYSKRLSDIHENKRKLKDKAARQGRRR